jgi:mRNA degradation ribonuclease J1/J2
MALSKSGVVFAVCLVDSHKLELAVRPRVHFHGLLFKQGENPEKVIEEARDILEDIFLKIKNLKDFEEKIKMELKTFFKKKVSHKPVIMPMVFEI